MPKQLIRIFISPLVLIVLVVLTGCAGAVYKERAGAYVIEGQKVVAAFEPLAAQRAANLEDKKRALIATDPKCDISSYPAYMRPAIDPKAGESESELQAIRRLIKAADVASQSSCQLFARCAPAQESPCSRVCLSVQDGVCLRLLEQSLSMKSVEAAKAAAEQKAVPAPANPWEKPQKEFNDIIAKLQLGRTQPSLLAITTVTLETLTGYLEALEPLTDDDPAETVARFKELSAKLDERIDDYKSVAGREALGDAAKATKAKVEGYLGGLAALSNHIRQIYRDARDKHAIIKLVDANTDANRENSKQLKNLMLGEYRLNVIDANAVAEARRIDLLTQYNSLHGAKPTATRLQRVAKAVELSPSIDCPQMQACEAKMEKLFEAYAKLHAKATETQLQDVVKAAQNSPNIDFPQIQASEAKIEKLFEAYDKSHNSLVTLIKDPTDKDKIAIARQAFREFRNIVGDLVAIIKLR